MSRKVKWALGVAIALFIAATVWNVATKITTTTKTTTTLSSVVDVLEENCVKEEHKDRQIKVLGEVEKALLELFLGLATKEPDAVSKEFVEQFAPLAQKIHILPLPDCKAIGDELRANLPPG